MRKKILITIIILVLASTLAASSTPEGRTRPIQMKLSGSIMEIGDGASLFDVTLMGRPGFADARGIGYATLPVHYEDLPEGNVCVDLPESPDGVLFNNAQMTIRFWDGSLLFGNVAEGAYVCFVPSFAYVPYDLVGGTGRYEGATGYVLFEIDAYRFNDPDKPSLVTAETGRGTGEIHMP